YSMNMKEVLEADYTDDGKILIKSNEVVTRGDAAFMLYMLLGMEPDTTLGFPDVGPSSPYYEAVSTVTSRNIVSGYEDGKFHPEIELTRSQMSRIIAGAFNYTINANATVPFTDVNERWAPYVDAMYRHGVTAGVTPTSFAPDKKITRGEMAAFMHRAYKKVPGSAYSEFEVMNVVNEATRKTRNVIVQGLAQHYPNQKASDISSDMGQLAIDPYLSLSLAGYEKSCYNCDGANALSDFQFGLPYEILGQTDTMLKMDTTVPNNSINSGHRAIIELVRSGDSWKIKSYVTRSFTSDPLALTIEQATDYLSYAVPVYWQEDVATIRHTGKDNATGYELFLINGKTTYLFDRNTGYLERK
ncbi:MAG TPA: S-layer homology domain-containing protein, partial [Paenisporosarcina sp.]|nr:S-layer homology domain-containing protein [Paenisporosarcina sp.]